MSFQNIFEKSNIEVAKQNLVLGNFFLLTAGTEHSWNTMTGSHPGFVLFMHKYCMSAFLGENRHTLEFIKKHQSFSMSFFDEQHKTQVRSMGFKSGRDTDKIKELGFETLLTPNGNLTFEQAKLVVDCKLHSLTQVQVDDLFDDDDKAKALENKGPH